LKTSKERRKEKRKNGKKEEIKIKEEE